jgi:hypothetical protein
MLALSNRNFFDFRNETTGKSYAFPSAMYHCTSYVIPHMC